MPDFPTTPGTYAVVDDALPYAVLGKATLSPFRPGEVGVTVASEGRTPRVMTPNYIVAVERADEVWRSALADYLRAIGREGAPVHVVEEAAP